MSWAHALILLASSPTTVQIELRASDVEAGALVEIERTIEAQLRRRGLEPMSSPCGACQERLQVFVVAGIARTKVELRGSERSVAALIPATGGRPELERLVDLWLQPIKPEAIPEPRSDALLWGLAGGAGLFAVAGIVGAIMTSDANRALGDQPRFGDELDRLEARAEVGQSVAVGGLCVSGVALGGVLLLLAFGDD